MKNPSVCLEQVVKIPALNKQRDFLKKTCNVVYNIIKYDNGEFTEKT